MTKVAVALFVKNECSDIAGWIAWYQAFGVDKLFIFDDYSTDGTFEIIQGAAKLYNIQILRTNPIEQPNFYWRQRDAFMQAAQLAKGKYDWIGFFDADEYIYLNNHNSFSDFLEQFPNADGVAINWCIYGNANKVIQPRGIPVEVFLEHSDLFFGDNQQVKSFVRPEKIGMNYINPHQFDIDFSKYVDVQGKTVEWRGPNKDVEWDGAKVMHYICRSMEQYVGRIKKRTDDLGDSLRHWQQYGFHFDAMSVDIEPLRMMPKVRQHIAKINQQIIQEIREKILTKPFLEALSFHSFNYETKDTDLQKPTLYQYFKEKFNIQENIPITLSMMGANQHYLYVSVTNQQLKQTTELEAEMKSLIPVLGIVFPYLPNVVVLTAIFDQRYYPVSFSIEGQYLSSLEHYLRVSFDENQQKYNVFSIYDSKKLGFEQQNTQKINFYDISEQHSACCYWDIHYVSQGIKLDYLNLANVSEQTNLQELYPVFQQLPKDKNREFMRLIVNLNPIEKAKIKLLFPGYIDKFL
ncbi:glycosyltransferase family 2 protein [Commensalibacter papalotli (ex Servin-Garciduenas et al. 2014)]|uniref:Uncharacterized protein n=1 Tax=Commensalibacter papalotli (ex Servin-Garciduenas et al. 2014) TaxID=1208583 RepID=W7DMY7_9PROT|nr:glycosyltransferase family 2 protein [Commensalibacter papalotli (ex Servin-Garciduenas et al. 2014)]EUK18637.1 hypothetical protein COMX_02775 [Commensalibacter papalotli (ex Servin-Garciduenas et al. 2014)]